MVDFLHVISITTPTSLAKPCYKAIKVVGLDLEFRMPVTLKAETETLQIRNRKSPDIELL